MFDNSISAAFQRRGRGAAGLVRDAIAMLWAMSLEWARGPRAALIDDPTGTWTRTYGLRYLEEWLGSEKALGNPLAVLFVDGDRFKVVNDRFGHRAGDRLLAAVGRVLTEAAGDAGIVFRYGGDEFVVVLPNAWPADAERFAEDLLHQLNSTLVDGLPVLMDLLKSDHGRPTLAIFLLPHATAF